MKSFINLVTILSLLIVASCNQNKRNPSETPMASDSTESISESLITKGTDTGGGGSTKDIQKMLVQRNRTYLYNEIVRITTQGQVPLLKSAAQSVSRDYLYYPNLNSRSVKMFEEMLEQGLLKDIRETEIVIAEKCVDQYGIERSATSAMNILKSDICLNPNSIIDDLGYIIPDSALIALILHEYAHHFGYEDKDYSFAVDIATAIEEQNKDAISNGQNPNNLIQPNWGN